MYPGYAMQQPMGPYMPWFPPPPQNTPQDPAQVIGGWIRSLEELKKSFKEEKKDDNKKKNDAPGVIATALFMLLISPVTGPIIYFFFKLSGTLLTK